MSVRVLTSVFIGMCGTDHLSRAEHCGTLLSMSECNNPLHKSRLSSSHELHRKLQTLSLLYNGGIIFVTL
jgi:hypothetical protein